MFHTIGELFLSPIGLSMVSAIAPVKLASLLMGVWLAGTGRKLISRTISRFHSIFRIFRSIRKYRYYRNCTGISTSYVL